MIEFIIILAVLILGHLLTDFFFQSSRMVEEKAKHSLKSGWSYVHAIIAGFIPFALFWELALHPVLWITALSHLLIDAAKNAWKDPQSARAFFADQAAHLGVAVILAVWIYNGPGLTQLFSTVPYALAIVLATGFLFLMKPASVVTQKLISLWTDSITVPSESTGENHLPGGLPKAGHYIGLLERILIFVFVLINQFVAIGFLIAAKSILRFGGQKQERIETEYILLGTLLSFTIAIIISLGVRYLLTFLI